MKIEIKHKTTDKVLWSGEAVDLKDAVQKAVASHASLDGADLFGASLDGARLDGARLAYANLVGASLARATLSNADLFGVDLANANLAGADLTGASIAGADLTKARLVGARLVNASLVNARLDGADLAGASLVGARLNEPICRMDFGGWSICVRETETSIGCQRHANSEWLKWTLESEEIRAMHPDAPAWWAVHGEAVKSAIQCVMSKVGQGRELIA
jgi:hypothetical protein